jgi:hypothetical protein
MNEKSYNFLKIISSSLSLLFKNNYLPGCIPSLDEIAEKIPAYLIRIMPAKGGKQIFTALFFMHCIGH